MDKLVKPERLIADPNAPSASDKFNHWFHMFNNYIEALPSVKPNTNKLQVLENLISWKLYRNISGIDNYETAISTLQRIFAKQSNILTSRRNLRTCKQHVDESVDDFVLRIKRLSKDCGCQAVNAETYRSELMCDALIDGIQSFSIRKRLLENCSLTFQQAYDQARSLEMMQSNAKTGTSSHVSRVQRKETLPSREQTHEKTSRLSEVDHKQHCRFCGKPRNHSRKSCPAKSAVCLYCRKVGHFSEVCNKRLQRFNNQENSTTLSEQHVPTISELLHKKERKDSCDAKTKEIKDEFEGENQALDSSIKSNFVNKHSLKVKEAAGHVSPADTSVKIHIEGSVAETMNALNLIDECVFHLTCNPVCYDLVVPKFIKFLNASNLIPCVTSVIVDKIFEMCLLEQNFRYLGCRLLDELSRNSTGLPRFRSCLLSKAQKENRRIDYTLKHNPERARSFILFMAELFYNLKLKTTEGLVKLKVLGKATLKLTQKLIDHENDYNIQCAVRVLKLTLASMRALVETMLDESERRDTTESIKQILSKFQDLHKKTVPNDMLTYVLLDDFVYLFCNCWNGRMEREKTQIQKNSFVNEDDDVLDKQDENYFMNEPTFFTPIGLMYTVADAVDPEFCKKYLAPLSQKSKRSTSIPSRPILDHDTVSE